MLLSTAEHDYTVRGTGLDGEILMPSHKTLPGPSCQIAGFEGFNSGSFTDLVVCQRRLPRRLCGAHHKS
jgi:hypothetical protein